MARTLGRKLMIGTLIGCGTLTVFGLAGCVSCVMWVKRPGEVLEPERLVGPATAGIVELTLTADDPQTEALARSLLETNSERNKEAIRGLNPTFRSLVESQSSREVDAQLGVMLPAVAVWTVHPGAGRHEDLHLFAINMKGFGNRMTMADIVLGWVFRLSSSAEYVKHRGEKIFFLGGPADSEEIWAFIRERNIFISNSLDNAKRSVDLLVGDRADVEVGGIDVRPYLAELPDAPLRGAFSNERDEVARIWENLVGSDLPPELAQVRAATIQGRFNDTQGFEGVLELIGTDASWADDLGAEPDPVENPGDGTGPAYGRWKPWTESEAEILIRIEGSGNRLRLHFLIEDIPAWLATLD